MAAGLSESVLNAGDFEYDFPCTECQEHGLNSEADFYCQHCTRQFCRLCVKQHDRFNSRHQILGAKKRDKWGKVKSTCKLHPGAELKVFCSTHGQPCCVTCQRELHRNCKNVILLQKMNSSSTPTHSGEPRGIDRARCTKSTVLTDVLPDKLYKIWMIQQLNVSLPNDTDACSIRGITVLPGGEIIITDHANSKLKLLSANYIVVDHFRVPLAPRGICNVVSDNQVAICFGGKEILFMEVRDRRLRMNRKLNLEHDCFYMSYREGHLYVSSIDSVYNYILSDQRVRDIGQRGREIVWEPGREIYKTLTGRIWAIAVSAGGGRLYINDYYNDTLVTVDIQGRVLATLKDENLKGTRCVHVSPSGNVFLCGSTSNTILQVDSEGKHRLTTLATKENGVPVCRPQALCFDSRTSSLLVGQHGTDNLLVLKLK
ncbi:hypothetical protein MAR_001251 [Mya arenaria]|uniref:B box-type domain-containing protein n=1 Tax=Mya arenaria TaxID=6604 RepID=A0ABY7FB67_MYAAR|nr:uncharacterized protein LOC128208058 [Mya arenaria]WAR19413.1 hypothetical protein MAR_001251 [Mya arenaria]